MSFKTKLKPNVKVKCFITSQCCGEKALVSHHKRAEGLLSPPQLNHGGHDAGEGDVPRDAQLGDLVQPLLTEVVLQQVSIIHSHLEVIRLTKDLELK